MKKTIIALVVVGIIGVGAYFLSQSSSSVTTPSPVSEETTKAPADTTVTIDKQKTIIGTSVGKRDIIAYHFGAGAKEILFVGGIHGGYEWNTALVAYQFIDYLKANPNLVPSNMTVTVIPVLNPDGLAKVVGTADTFDAKDVSTSKDTVIAGRFNGNTVDLNRNFDCDWKAKGVWQETTVSGGSEAFSEPESQAMKKYVGEKNPVAVVVWYSSANGVFASSCHNGVLPETKKLTDLYAKASGYPAYNSFDFYAITGDMVNWLAKEEIPAISVLLSTHQDTEWDKNLAGIKALLTYYAQ